MKNYFDLYKVENKRILEFNNCRITDETLKLLFDLLIKNGAINIRRLNIANNQIKTLPDSLKAFEYVYTADNPLITKNIDILERFHKIKEEEINKLDNKNVDNKIIEESKTEL